MFNRIAFRYDFLNRFLSFGVDIGWRKKVVRMVTADAPTSILDVATGTGDLAIMLARANPRAEITGVDLSPDMLAAGRKKVAEKGIANIVAMVEGDAEHLPFADETFDTVTVAFGVRNFENIPAGLAEINRVLKTGGKMYVLEFAMPKSKIFGTLFHFYFRRLLPFIGGLVSGEHKAYRYLQQSVEAFPYGERFTALMEETGFVENSRHGMTDDLAIIYRGIKR